MEGKYAINLPSNIITMEDDLRVAKSQITNPSPRNGSLKDKLQNNKSALSAPIVNTITPKPITPSTRPQSSVLTQQHSSTQKSSFATPRPTLITDLKSKPPRAITLNRNLPVVPTAPTSSDIVHPAPKKLPIPIPKKLSQTSMPKINPIPRPRNMAPISSNVASRVTQKPITQTRKDFLPTTMLQKKINNPIPISTPHSSKKKIILLGIIVAFVLFGGIFAYFQFIDNEDPSSVPNENIVTITETIPPSLISVFSEETIALNGEGAKDVIYLDLQTLLDQPFLIGKFMRLIVEYSNIDASRNVKYVTIGSFDDFMKNNLGVNVPQAIANSVVNYTPFIYSQNEGNKFGIILKLNESHKDIDYTNIMREWEDTMIFDFRSLFFQIGVLNPSIELELPIFSSNQYRNMAIRYVNFISDSHSIDYAFLPLENTIIITTSKDSMYATIDNILAK